MAQEFKVELIVYGNQRQRLDAVLMVVTLFPLERGHDLAEIRNTHQAGVGFDDGVTVVVFYSRGSPSPQIDQLSRQFPELVFRCRLQDLTARVIYNFCLQNGSSWDESKEYDVTESRCHSGPEDDAEASDELAWTPSGDACGGAAGTPHRSGLVDWDQVRGPAGADRAPPPSPAERARARQRTWAARRRHEADPLAVDCAVVPVAITNVDGVGFAPRYAWNSLQRLSDEGKLDGRRIRSIGYDPLRDGDYFTLGKAEWASLEGPAEAQRAEATTDAGVGRQPLEDIRPTAALDRAGGTSFTLVRGGGSLGLGYRSWASALSLGLRHGWVPDGAAFNDRAVRQKWLDDGLEDARVEEAVEWERGLWYGGYVTNDHQTVSAADAAALADALSRASAVPGRLEPAFPKPQRIDLPMGDFIDFTFGPQESAADPSEAFVSDEGRHLLQQIIDFCRGGEFEIH